MINKWNVDVGALRLAEQKLKSVTMGEKNTQPWIHQKEINERLISLIAQLNKKIGSLRREIE